MLKFPQQMRAPYERPKLTVYGSVRNLTGGSKQTSNDAGQGTAGHNVVGSDRRVKEKIVEVARHSAGFSLYLFDYIPEFRDEWGHGRQFGVMADEVKGIVPQAVSTSKQGYDVVDYGKLGITRH